MRRNLKNNKLTKIQKGILFINRQDFRGWTWKWIKKKMKLIDNCVRIP